MKSTVILVHGAWHNGAGFARLQAELKALGFDSQTVELPSVGTADQSLGDMYGDAAVVRAAVDSIDGDCVVLGHSYGGLSISPHSCLTPAKRFTLPAEAWIQSGGM